MNNTAFLHIVLRAICGPRAPYHYLTEDNGQIKNVSFRSFVRFVRPSSIVAYDFQPSETIPKSPFNICQFIFNIVQLLFAGIFRESRGNAH